MLYADVYVSRFGNKFNIFDGISNETQVYYRWNIVYFLFEMKHCLIHIVHVKSVKKVLTMVMAIPTAMWVASMSVSACRWKWMIYKYFDHKLKLLIKNRLHLLSLYILIEDKINYAIESLGILALSVINKYLPYPPPWWCPWPPHAPP